MSATTLRGSTRATRKRRRGRGRPAAVGNDFDSREALLRAAHEVLSASGGKSVPLTAICRRAGVDVAMVSYHFGSKRGLMISLFERICGGWPADLDALLALPTDTHRKLHIHVREIVRNFQRYPYVTRLMTELIMSSKPGTAKRLAHIFVRPLTDFYRRLFAQGLGAHELRKPDTMFFFFSIVGACEFIFAARPLLASAFGVTSIDQDIERKYVEHTVELLLKGIEAR